MVSMIAGLSFGHLLALCSKKKEVVTYSKLDKSRGVVNIADPFALIHIYRFNLPPRLQRFFRRAWILDLNDR